MSEVATTEPMTDVSSERRRHSENALSSDRSAFFPPHRRFETPNSASPVFAHSSAHMNSTTDRTLSPVSWRHNPYGARRSSPSIDVRSPTVQLPGGPRVTVATRGSGTGHMLSVHGVNACNRSTSSWSRTDMDEWRPPSPAHFFAQDTQTVQQLQLTALPQQGAQDVRQRRSVSLTGFYWPHPAGPMSLSASSSGLPHAPCPNNNNNNNPRNFSIRSSQSSISTRSGTDGLLGSFFSPTGISLCTPVQTTVAGNFTSAISIDIPHGENTESQSTHRRASSTQIGIKEFDPYEGNPLPQRVCASRAQMEHPNPLSVPRAYASDGCHSSYSSRRNEEDEVENENENDDIDVFCGTILPSDAHMQFEAFKVYESTSAEDSFPATAAESTSYRHACSVTVVPQSYETREPHADPLHGWTASGSDGKISPPPVPPEGSLGAEDSSIGPSALRTSERTSSSTVQPTGEMTKRRKKGMTSESTSPSPQTLPSSLLNIPPTIKAAHLEQRMMARANEQMPCTSGFYFSVYDADLQQHYVIESAKVFATRGSVRYIALYEIHGTQSRFRFQICKRYLQKHCIKGINCQYIHTRDIPSPTRVHVNENVVNHAAIDSGEFPEEDIRGGKNTHKYITMPSGVHFRVFPPNKSKINPQIIPSEMILHTIGSVSVYSILVNGINNDNKSNKSSHPHGNDHPNEKTEDAEDRSSPPEIIGEANEDTLDINNLKPRHCAHFQFNKMCNLGMNCNFIHSLVPYVQSSSDSMGNRSPSSAPLVQASWSSGQSSPGTCFAYPAPFAPMQQVPYAIAPAQVQRQVPQRRLPQGHVQAMYGSGVQMVHVSMYNYDATDTGYLYSGEPQLQQIQQCFAQGITCGFPAQSFHFAPSLSSLGVKPFAPTVATFGTIPHEY